MAGTARRRAYLEAMGIQGWVRRDAAPAGAEAGVTAAEAAPSATPAAGPQGADPASARSAPVTRPSAPTSPSPGEAPPPFTDEPPLPTEEPAPSAFGEPPAGIDEEATKPAGIDVGTLDWDALQAAVARCTACELHATRTQTVFGVGNRDADWMIVGEAPGADEDRQGEPFVGRAGQLLDSMLRAIGLQREEVYIANVIKCRPPNNRNPHADEIERCLGYLRRQVELVRPRLILVVGRVAAHALLGVDTPLGRLRGQVHRFGDTPVVVTYHPAYLLRTPRDKAKSWADLRFARRVIAEAGGATKEGPA